MSTLNETSPESSVQSPAESSADPNLERLQLLEEQAALGGGQRGNGQYCSDRGSVYASTDVGGHLLGGLRQRRHGRWLLARWRQIAPQEFGAVADDGLSAGVKQMPHAGIEVEVTCHAGLPQRQPEL